MSSMSMTPRYHDLEHWQGDVPESSRRSNPLSIEMDRDKYVQAVFSLIHPPLTPTGRRIFLSFRKGAVDVLDWAPDPRNHDIERYRVYVDTGGVPALLAEVTAGVCRYMRRLPIRDAPVRYLVCAVTSAGRQGVPAPIEVR